MARKVIYTDADGDEFFVTTTAPRVFVTTTAPRVFGAYRPSTDVAVSVLLPKNPEAIDGLLTEFAAALGREPCDGGFRELRRSPLEVWVRESLMPYVETHRNYAKMSTPDVVFEAFLVAVTDPAVWADFQEAIHPPKSEPTPEGPRALTADEYTSTLAACRMASNGDDGDTAPPCVD